MRAPPNLRVLPAPKFVIYGDTDILNEPQAQKGGQRNGADAKCEPGALKRFLTQGAPAGCREERNEHVSASPTPTASAIAASVEIFAVPSSPRISLMILAATTLYTLGKTRYLDLGSGTWFTGLMKYRTSHSLC